MSAAVAQDILTRPAIEISAAAFDELAAKLRATGKHEGATRVVGGHRSDRILDMGWMIFTRADMNRQNGPRPAEEGKITDVMLASGLAAMINAPRNPQEMVSSIFKAMTQAMRDDE